MEKCSQASSRDIKNVAKRGRKAKLDAAGWPGRPKSRLPGAMILIGVRKSRLNYGKRECAVPLGLGASPSRGSLRGKAKDRDNNWTFFEKSWKMLENVGKNRKIFQKDRPICLRLVFEVVFSSIFS